MRIQLERLSVEGEKAAKNSLSDFFTSTIEGRLGSLVGLACVLAGYLAFLFWLGLLERES